MLAPLQDVVKGVSNTAHTNKPQEPGERVASEVVEGVSNTAQAKRSSPRCNQTQYLLNSAETPSLTFNFTHQVRLRALAALGLLQG